MIAAFALQEEVVELKVPGFETVNVVTGVGKARAAMMLMKAVLELHPVQVINVGTAGTFSCQVGDIVVAHHFIDRDFMPLRLPGLSFEETTPAGALYALFPPLLGGGKVSGRTLTVSTGDDFVTSPERAQGDVVDMEAFAEALVCKNENIPFFAVKYVTDVVGRNSVRHWEDKLVDARQGLTAYFASHAG